MRKIFAGLALTLALVAPASVSAGIAPVGETQIDCPGDGSGCPRPCWGRRCS